MEDVIETVAATPLKEATAELLRDDLSTALQILPPREREIITLRFGLRGEAPLTLEEVGKHFNLTRERATPAGGPRHVPPARIARNAFIGEVPAQRSSVMRFAV